MSCGLPSLRIILGIEPGQKRRVIFDAGGSEIPATIIDGQEEGMTLLVMAGVHPDEYPGMAASIRVAQAMEPERLSGRLIIIHCANPSGFWARSRFVPEDGVNLNGDYPGKPDGSPGERIADFFVKQFFPHVDFIVDLHSGSPMEPLTPCLFFPSGAGDRVRETSLSAAMDTDIPYLIASHAESGEYSYAAKAMGIPGLLLERGHSGLCPREWVDAYEDDLYRLLQHLGMIALPPFDSKPVCAKILCEKTVYLGSEHKGLWYPDIHEGQSLKKGERLGHIEDFWGNRLKEYHAQDDGLVFYYNAGLAVRPGDPLVAYGLKDFMKPAGTPSLTGDHR